MPRQQLNSYQDVQSLFNDFITANSINMDRAPHGAFWNSMSYDEFVNGNVPGLPIAVKNLISGNAADSNLIKILKGSLTVAGRTFRRMPGGGPYFSDDMVAALADWIDRGCPNPQEQTGRGRSAGGRSPFETRNGAPSDPRMESLVHVIRDRIVCGTDRRGHTTPRGLDPTRLVLDASEGFIPLWEPDTVLRWRFRERSLDYFANPAAAKAGIRDLIADALLKWGSAAPVTFRYDEDLWDFEVVMHSGDDCSIFGCVLASAFFPDSGRHALEIYPQMFTQSRKEQVDTFIHEFGHVFGLRHFFANVQETAFPSVIFGRHEKFSIMNYGDNSELTNADKEDLTLLYDLVWSGELTHVNGTPIRLFRPYSAFLPSPVEAHQCAHALAAMQAQHPSGYGSPVSPLRLAAPMRSRSRAAYLD